MSMLWESTDPYDALEARFGFGAATAAMEWLDGVLARHWGLRVRGCGRLVISDSNCLAWVTVDGDAMVAKWSMRQSRFERLVAVGELTSWLGERGIPVSRPVPANDGRVQVEVDGVSVGLQRVVEGELLDIEDPAQVRAAGEVLARMHAVMADYPGTIPTEEPLAPGTQLVGNDFRSANILWSQGRIAAVLDLEEATYRRRAEDLGRAAVLLGTRYHDWRATPEKARNAFVRAYENVLPLNDEEAAALEEEIAKTIEAVGV
ncbi:homoserine kinase type II (protein kinase fold) [Nocardioides luteus]|uniref:Homoserine kinase type II n=1 Tax=Nocardioides luteus TaxID=1844 RepID=A0ABQ5SUB9_9ACTN|nr:homoserine kinase type II (protein kinase fold) [Nocardioides luteus]GLJ67414.1 homoserine kinase type II [Nocardioides luteus]